MSWWSSLTGGSGGSTNLWGAVLSGLSGAAGAYMSGKASEKDAKNALKAIGAQGIESRKTLAYTAQLEDFYAQQDKARKRRALDTYGQFSLLDRYAPNYNAPAPLDQPKYPGAT